MNYSKNINHRLLSEREYSVKHWSQKLIKKALSKGLVPTYMRSDGKYIVKLYKVDHGHETRKLSKTGSEDV